MNLTNDNAVMIFRNEYQGKTFYKMGLSKKDQNGNYVNGYMACQFKKDVSLTDKTKIYIKKAFLTFYIDKDKKTIPYVFINEFTTLDKAIEPTREVVKEKSKTDPYAEFGQEIADIELPF